MERTKAKTSVENTGEEKLQDPARDKQTALNIVTESTEQWPVGDPAIIGPMAMVLQAQNTWLILSLQGLHAKIDRLQKEQNTPISKSKIKDGERPWNGSSEVIPTS